MRSGRARKQRSFHHAVCRGLFWAFPVIPHTTYILISTDIYLNLHVSVRPLVQRRLAAARMLINDMTTLWLQWGQEEFYLPACQYLHRVDTPFIISPTAPECLLAISRYLHPMQRQNSCCCCNAFHGVNNSLHQLQHQCSHLCRGLSSSA